MNKINVHTAFTDSEARRDILDLAWAHCTARYGRTGTSVQLYTVQLYPSEPRRDQLQLDQRNLKIAAAAAAAGRPAIDRGRRRPAASRNGQPPPGRHRGGDPRPGLPLLRLRGHGQPGLGPLLYLGKQLMLLFLPCPAGPFAPPRSRETCAAAPLLPPRPAPLPGPVRIFKSCALRRLAGVGALLDLLIWLLDLAGVAGVALLHRGLLQQRPSPPAPQAGAGASRTVHGRRDRMCVRLTCYRSARLARSAAGHSCSSVSSRYSAAGPGAAPHEPAGPGAVTA
eukprot:SAG22_NODE_2800_length_2200_cov_1.099000_3_plen_282_part_00